MQVLKNILSKFLLIIIFFILIDVFCFFYSVGLVYTTGHQSVYGLVFRVAGEVLSPSDLVFFAILYPRSEF